MAFTKVAQDRPRVLIVGGGYVGFTVAKKIQKAIKETGGVVTIVEPNPYMTYQPFLPEVAAGSMEGRNATVPLRQHLRDTELIPGRVVSIDHANRTAVVEPTDNGEPFELKYDEIVLGAGAVTRAFPIPGLAEVAIGLKTIEEAVSVRNWVLDRIEVASMLSDAEARRRALTFVIVGGGFAGVETISELEDMARVAVERNERLSVSDLHFVMVEAAPRIMPEVPADRAEKVVAELRARGIEILLNTSLSDATDGNLQLINMADKSPAGEIKTDTLIWTAGVAASPMLKNTDFPIDERGRVRVSADLRVTGDDGVVEGAWAAGDNAAVPDLSGGGVGGFCVPNAQHASRQAVVLAKNLLAARRGEPPDRLLPRDHRCCGRSGSVEGRCKLQGQDHWRPAGMDHAPRLPRLCNPHHRAYRSRYDHLGSEPDFRSRHLLDSPPALPAPGIPGSNRYCTGTPEGKALK